MQDPPGSLHTSGGCVAASTSSVSYDDQYVSPHSRHASFMERLFDINSDILPSNFVVGMRVSSCQSQEVPSHEDLRLSLRCLLKQHPLLCCKLVRNYHERKKMDRTAAVEQTIVENGKETDPGENNRVEHIETTTNSHEKKVVDVDNTQCADPNDEFVLYLQCHDPNQAPEMNFVRELVWDGTSLVACSETIVEEKQVKQKRHNDLTRDPNIDGTQEDNKSALFSSPITSVMSHPDIIPDTQQEELTSATFGPRHFKSFVESQMRDRMDHFGPRVRLHYIRLAVHKKNFAEDENTSGFSPGTHSELSTNYTDTYVFATFDHVTCDAMSAIMALRDYVQHLHTVLRLTKSNDKGPNMCHIDDSVLSLKEHDLLSRSSSNTSIVGVLNGYYDSIIPVTSPGEGVWRPANYKGYFKTLRSIGNVIYDAFKKGKEVRAELLPFEQVNKKNAELITLYHELSLELTRKLVLFSKYKCKTTVNGLLCAALAKSVVSIGFDSHVGNRRWWANCTRRTRINNTVDVRKHYEPYAKVAKNAVGCYIRVAFQSHTVSGTEDFSGFPAAAKKATDLLQSYIHNGDAMTSLDPLFGLLMPPSLLISALGQSPTEQAKEELAVASSKIINGGVCLSNLGVVDSYFTDEAITDDKQQSRYSVDSFYFSSNPGAFASTVLGTYSFKGVLSLSWTAWTPSMTAERLGILNSTLVAFLETLASEVSDELICTNSG